MPIEFNCAQCNKSFTVADSAAGKTGRCSDCGNLNTIPAASSGGSVAASGGSSGMFEVTSSVNGSVFGPADRSTLDQWLSENRITPECQIKEVGTDQWVVASQFFPQLKNASHGGAAPAAAVSSPSVDPFDKFKSADARQKASAPTFGGNASTAVNPFEAARTDNKNLVVSGEVVPTAGDVSFILSHSFKNYKKNFGVLLGGTVVYLVANFAMGFLGAVIESGLGAPGTAISAILNFVVSTYFIAGVINLMLKVGREEPVAFQDMFDVSDRWLPLIGYVVLLYLALLVPLAIGGIALAALNQAGDLPQQVIIAFGGAVILLFIVATLLIWPGYLLIVDRKSGVLQAFGLGFAIAKKNVLQSMAVFLLSAVITWAGLLALCVGIIFTMPLGMLIIVCAYLNMSGQIRE